MAKTPPNQIGISTLVVVALLLVAVLTLTFRVMRHYRFAMNPPQLVSVA